MTSTQITTISQTFVLANHLATLLMEDQCSEQDILTVIDRQAEGVDILATTLNTLDSKVEFLEQEIKNLVDYKKSIVGRVDWLKSSLLEQEDLGNIPKKLIGNVKAISMVKNSAPKVEFLGTQDDLIALHQSNPELVNRKETTLITYSLNKEYILGAGEDFDMIVISRGKHIRISNAPVTAKG
jgi:hypothetical protein